MSENPSAKYLQVSSANGGGSFQRLAWRLNHDLEEYSGLSVPFWRKVIANKGIPVTKVGRASLLMDADVREYLRQRSQLHEVQPLTEDEKARRNAKRAATEKGRLPASAAA